MHLRNTPLNAYYRGHAARNPPQRANAAEVLAADGGGVTRSEERWDG
jgi:hypothetical protein